MCLLFLVNLHRGPLRSGVNIEIVKHCVVMPPVYQRSGRRDLFVHHSRGSWCIQRPRRNFTSRSSPREERARAIKISICVILFIVEALWPAHPGRLCFFPWHCEGLVFFRPWVCRRWLLEPFCFPTPPGHQKHVCSCSTFFISHSTIHIYIYIYTKL